jgi:hypothetical protein
LFWEGRELGFALPTLFPCGFLFEALDELGRLGGCLLGLELAFTDWLGFLVGLERLFGFELAFPGWLGFLVGLRRLISFELAFPGWLGFLVGLERLLGLFTGDFGLIMEALGFLLGFFVAFFGACLAGLFLALVFDLPLFFPLPPLLLLFFALGVAALLLLILLLYVLSPLELLPSARFQDFSCLSSSRLFTSWTSACALCLTLR